MLIEVIIFLVIVGLVIFWSMLMFITKKFKLWRYKPENDKGRLAEESRGRTRLQGVVLPTSPKGFKLLPTAPIDTVGKIKSIIGTPSNRPRKLGFFKRR
jgi:hypothetical protein